MKNKLKIIFLFLLFSFNSFTQQSEQDKKMAWRHKARFGMFIHWGPYVVQGGDYHGYLSRVGGPAWMMNRCRIPVKEYQGMTKTFNPIKCSPEEWILLAKSVGIKYIIITAKRHGGFAMFKNSANNYDIVDFIPYGKDVLGGLAKACRKHKMKLGFYYSQAQGWDNPGGATHRRSMGQGWPNPDAERIDAYTAAYNGSWDPIQQARTMEGYTDSVAVPQIKELPRNYGDVVVVQWDAPSGPPTLAGEINEVIKKYPHIIASDRLVRNEKDTTGDYKTPEQAIPIEKQLGGTDWGTYMTLNGSWGYQCRGVIWESPQTLITNLIDIVPKGGDFLLNISPAPDGFAPEGDTQRLDTVRKWMKKYGSSIYGAERYKVKKPDFGYCTQKVIASKTHVYLHVIEWPENGELLSHLYQTASSARLLHNGQILNSENAHDGVYTNVPSKAPDNIASVIELAFDCILPRYPIKPMNENNYDIIDGSN